MGFEQESVRMHTPAYPGEVIGEVVNATDWTVSEAATELGVLLPGHCSLYRLHTVAMNTKNSRIRKNGLR